jgi:putative ABC transport system permease protein
MIFETVRLALRTLRNNLFRTMLTMLSVTIGTFSIVVMLSLAESGHETLSQKIEEIGGSRMVLWIPSEDRVLTPGERAMYDRGFTLQDLEVLRQVPYLAAVASESTYGTEAVWAEADDPIDADIIGMRGGLLSILNWELAEGRVVSETDNDEKRRVAVITAPLAASLFPAGSAIGQTMMIGRKPYIVIGVLEERNVVGLNFGFSWETTVFVPQVTAEKREGRPEEAKFFVGHTSDPDRNESVVALANAALLANHRGVEDFQSMDFGSLMKQFYAFFQVLDLIVAAIAGISLFAGGIGVMNIMLVSVTERVREIGIRKALGASRRAILAQFLIEASTLSVTGGMIGVVAALGMAAVTHLIIRQFLDSWIGTYSTLGVGLALGVTASIGVLFGAVPAWRASRLDIVECLRR